MTLDVPNGVDEKHEEIDGHAVHMIVTESLLRPTHYEGKITIRSPAGNVIKRMGAFSEKKYGLDEIFARMREAATNIVERQA